MLKKDDPYIALLDFYYEKFPEAVTLKEAYEFLHRKGFISSEELEVIKAFGSTRQEKDKKSHEVEISANRKRVVFEKMFMRAGQSMSPPAYRNAPHILNSEHYFHRLEFIELKEAIKSSRIAFRVSIFAILISAGSLYLSWDNSKKPINISKSQINEIVTSINSLREDTQKQIKSNK